MGVLAAGLAVPALANEGALDAPVPEFTAADTQQLFEQDARPMQLAALSAQEMKETEGAWVNYAIGGFAGGLYNGISYYGTPNRTYAGWATSIGSGVVGGCVRICTLVVCPNMGWRDSLFWRVGSSKTCFYKVINKWQRLTPLSQCYMRNYFVLVITLLILNPFWRHKFPLLELGYSIFKCKKFNLEEFDFPRWQSLLSILIIGILVGLNFALYGDTILLIHMPLPLMLLLGIAVTCFVFLCFLLIIRYWLLSIKFEIADRLLFNWLVATALFGQIFCMGLMGIQSPNWLVILMVFYSLWVYATSLRHLINHKVASYKKQ